jgi:hypothetical protein
MAGKTEVVVFTHDFEEGSSKAGGPSAANPELASAGWHPCCAAMLGKKRPGGAVVSWLPTHKARNAGGRTMFPEMLNIEDFRRKCLRSRSHSTQEGIQRCCNARRQVAGFQ